MYDPKPYLQKIETDDGLKEIEIEIRFLILIHNIEFKFFIKNKMMCF